MSSSGSIFSQRRAWLNFRKGGFQGHLGGLLVVVRLEILIQPYIGGPAEVALEAQGGVHGERALAFHDLADAPGRDANVLGDAEYKKEFAASESPGIWSMGR